MADVYDGKELIEILKKYLSKGASVLELGMGSALPELAAKRIQ